MSLRIIRIAAALAGCVLLMAGCIRRSELTPDPEPAADIPVRFEAGSLLLRDDANTKAGTVIEGTAFPSGTSLSVFGWHKASSSFITFGTTIPVTKVENLWTYAPTQSWEWDSENDDYYDFLAVYPYKADRTFTTEGNAPRTSVSFVFNAKTEQADLMAAGVRRRFDEVGPPPGNEALDPCRLVDLTFAHQLCAVQVEIQNISLEQDITLKSVYFKNLIFSGALKLTIDNSGYATSWSQLARTSESLFGKTDINTVLYHAGSTSGSSNYICPPDNQQNQEQWDLMIPQSLGQAVGGDPTLYISYSYQQGSDPPVDVNNFPVPLSDILNEQTRTPIGTWLAGTKYTYEIRIRIGGGVEVNVYTTQWDIVPAETPGLQI